MRLTLSGTVTPEDYAGKSDVYKALLAGFMTYEIDDTALCEQITEEKIRAEFAEIGFAAQLLKVQAGKRMTGGSNFRVNPFNISLGLTICL